MPKVVINGRKQGKNALGGATGKKRATTKSARSLVRRPGGTILVFDDVRRHFFTDNPRPHARALRGSHRFRA